MHTIEFNPGASADAKKWFSLAINAGILSLDHRSENYVGRMINDDLAQ